MQNQKKETAIIIKRPTRLELLKSRFNTAAQAKFYIKQNKVAYKQKKIQMKSGGMSKKEIMQQEAEAVQEAENEYSQYEEEHRVFYDSLSSVQKQLSEILKVKILEQNYIPNYIFSDKEIIVVVGQDGLVANVAKYANGLPIIGVNPDYNRYDGVLLPFNPDNFMRAVENVIDNSFDYEAVTMAEAKLNDGQTMLAFNDFFIGINSHASARYSIEFNNEKEYQISSGIIISTGVGSTGWLSSFFNMANGFVKQFFPTVKIPFQPIDRQARELMFVVREPFVSKTSQANIVVGKVYENQVLRIESHMPQNGFIFSDGIQTDYLEFNSGTIAEIGISRQQAILVK